MSLRLIALGPGALLAMLAMTQAPAIAQSAPAAQDGPLDSLARQVGQRSKPVQPSEFVRESRPNELNFVPVHSKRPEPQGKLLTPDELKAKERELDALRVSHDKEGDRKPLKAAYKPLVAPAPPKKAKPAPAAEPQPVKLDIPTLR